MECFSVLWARRPSPEPVNVWYTTSNNQDRARRVEDLCDVESSYRRSTSNLARMDNNRTAIEPMDLRDLVRYKAEKHREYYRSLVPDDDSSAGETQMALRVSCSCQTSACGQQCHAESTRDEAGDVSDRQRKTCVYQTPAEPQFQSVKALRQKYIDNLCIIHDKHVQTLAPPHSGYSSSSTGSDDEKHGCYHRVERSASSDSAVGLTQSDEEILCTELSTLNTWNCETPHCGSTYSPYSPRGSIDHYNVPTKTIIEAQCVPLPLDRKASDVSDFEYDATRRHSTFTDDGDEQPRYRYWRTPSVVVSDYSDDVMGFSLEDIEYFRNQRKERSSSPDSSLHSSCSNLNYVGSSISTLDAEYIRCQPFRKSSDCSTCSTLSGDEGDQDTCHYKAKPSGWRKIRNIVQWTPFFQTYKKQRYPWVQLAGHQGNFKAGPDQGTILKKLCSKEERCFKILMRDVLRPYVPEFKGLVESDGDSSYLQLQDLLGDFVSPCVMDCKIGVRTYLEEELAKAKEKPKLRKDMYEKMCQIDKDAPTEEEHRLKGVTKPRYMVWRETISSTATLGFRIEGLRRADGTSSKDFKTTKTKEQIIRTFKEFTDAFPHAIPKYIQRLKAIKATLESSQFFATHEVIGSSLLFVHDRFNANVWLIDFAKTVLLPDNIEIDHNSKWVVGNHEDGYLIGVNNLISIFVTMLEQQPVSVTPPPLLPQDSEEMEEELLEEGIQ